MIYIKKLFSVLILACSFLIAQQEGILAAPASQITICHHTGSQINPYTKITVPSISTGGHFDNDGNPLHGGDLFFQGNVECPTSAPTTVPEFTTITAIITMTAASAFLLKKYSFQ